MLHTLMITADPETAAYADRCGVDTIFIDMETRGKAERQGHLDTHKAAHTVQDVAQVAPALRSAELLVRVNPLWSGTSEEVEGCLSAGARRFMLPMFRRPDEVEDFLRLVDGRVPVTLLVETVAALVHLPVIVGLLRADDRIHFGLNDLSLELGLPFLFQVLGGRLLDGPAAVCREAGVSFGVGGVGRVGQGALPADWILGEHVRLGSSAVILSRAFHGGGRSLRDLRAALDLRQELAALGHCLREWEEAPQAELRHNHQRLAAQALALGNPAA